MSKPTVEAHGLRKAFGEVQALDGLSLAVTAGSVFGLLGPNGSGKTTTVSILATSLRPDVGRATVGGRDVVTEAAQVRRVIGLAGQFAAVDPNLTGRENLRLIGRLSRVDRRQARVRADELLDSFGLNAAAGRLVRGYSGGMRRRLDVAAALLHRPAVLFLDEPTTGLDPESRFALWDSVRDLAALGLVVAFGYAISWGFASLGLRVSDPEAAQAAAVPVMFLLVFTSAAFVPATAMPGWLQAFGTHQPVDALVNAERALILGGPAAHDVLISLAWSGGLLVVFALLAARTYARMGR
ncbi:MAG TPA: ATP-binding cassette domain-containing protein [Streptosporangiaceae bacterium]